MFLFDMHPWPWILEITFTVINLILALIIIFIERKNPDKTLAWILVLFFLPVVGALFYLIFAQNISRRKIYKLDDKDVKIIRESVNDQIYDINNNKLEFSSKVAELWRHMVKLNLVYGESYLTQNNSIDMFTDGKVFFRRLIKDINAAKY